MQSQTRRLWKAPVAACVTRSRCHVQFGMQNAALACTTLHRAARLTTKIRAPHKGKFSLDVIEQPSAFFQTLDGNFFHLRKCVKV